jgi:hypothetical protein
VFAWKDEGKRRKTTGYSVFERGASRIQVSACCGGSVLKYLSAVTGVIPLKDIVFNRILFKIAVFTLQKTHCHHYKDLSVNSV